jgi:hypothetical protein
VLKTTESHQRVRRSNSGSNDITPVNALRCGLAHAPELQAAKSTKTLSGEASCHRGGNIVQVNHTKSMGKSLTGAFPSKSRNS